MKRSNPIARSGERVRAGGFTLIEIMVALIVTTIGLLGIAKVQALAFASNGAASSRALVATEAAGLASAMRANRVYWAFVPPAAPLVITGTVITSDATLEGLANGSTFLANACSGGTVCLPQTMAANDLHIYAAAMNALVFNPRTTITCPAVTPISCTIQVSWTEKAAVAVNNTAVASAANDALVTPTLTLYVQP